MWWMIAYAAAKTILGTREDTKAAMDQNKTAMKQLGKQISQINMSRAVSRQRTGQALYNIQIQGQNAMSQVGLQAAASGTMGASVNDAVSTIQLTTDRQAAGAITQQEQQEEGFRLMVTKAVDDTHANMDWESGADKLWDNLMQSSSSLMGQAAAKGATSGGGASNNSTAAPADNYQNYGYDLWGNRAAGSNNTSQAGPQSWKSYLGNS